MEAASDDLADQVFASILDTARSAGVDSRSLLEKLQDRCQNELNSQAEPDKKKHKAEIIMDENETSQQGHRFSTVPEIAMGIFQLHGLKFLPDNVLFPSFALLSKTHKHKAMRELAIRCKAKHPSLFAAATSLDENGQALLSWGQWCQFELDEARSRGLEEEELPPLRISDVCGNVDVLLEVSKGDTIVWHGVSPLLQENDVAKGVFHVPHWTFHAPLPEEGDEFFELDDTIVPGARSYLFWDGREDCSLQQKTLVKALYGAHSSLLVQTMPPIHVRVVLRQRSTGRMVTIISKSEPHEIVGEDYWNGDVQNQPGSYRAIYLGDFDLSRFDDRLFARVDLNFACPRIIDESAKIIRFSTRDVEAELDTAQQSDHFELPFIFDLNEAYSGNELTTAIVSVMRDWFQATEDS